jgi:hypothetical protein
MTSKVYPVSKGGLKSRYVSGILTFYDASGNVVYQIDPTNRRLQPLQINFDGVTRVAGKQCITGGTYDVKMPCPTGSGSKTTVNLHSEQTGTPFTYHTFESLGLSGAANEGVVGKHFTLDCKAGADSPSAHVSELHLNLVAGFSLNDGGADAVADGACLWAKIYGKGDTVDAGATLAGVWIDHQLGIASIGAGAKEYSIFVTAGGTVPTAIIGTKTTSSGWTYFVAFQDSAAPVGAAVTACGGSDASIAVLVGATPYFIPLYNSLSS